MYLYYSKYLYQCNMFLSAFGQGQYYFFKKTSCTTDLRIWLWGWLFLIFHCLFLVEKWLDTEEEKTKEEGGAERETGCARPFRQAKQISVTAKHREFMGKPFKWFLASYNSSALTTHVFFPIFFFKKNPGSSFVHNILSNSMQTKFMLNSQGNIFPCYLSLSHFSPFLILSR